MQRQYCWVHIFGLICVFWKFFHEYCGIEKSIKYIISFFFKMQKNNRGREKMHKNIWKIEKSTHIKLTPTYCVHKLFVFTMHVLEWCKEKKNTHYKEKKNYNTVLYKVFLWRYLNMFVHVQLKHLWKRAIKILTLCIMRRHKLHANDFANSVNRQQSRDFTICNKIKFDSSKNG